MQANGLCNFFVTNYPTVGLSRVYEFRQLGHSTEDSVLRAMASQSNTITVAGCIMAVAFAVRRSTPALLFRCSKSSTFGSLAPRVGLDSPRPTQCRPPRCTHSNAIIGCRFASPQSLLFSSTAVLNQFGFVLVVATLADTFVVRALLVPALMFIAVEWNWWPGEVPPVAIRLG